jgi:predicted kinase
MKELFLLRGLPGSGKSTLARSLKGKHLEADMFFVDSEGNYKFDPKEIKYAHNWCQQNVEICMMESISRIVISNTFTQEWEMDFYYKVAEKFGYTVYSLVVENRHGGINQHGVPTEKLDQMRDRFEIKL